MNLSMKRREKGMKYVPKRAKYTVLVVALATGAVAAWSNLAAPTDSEVRQVAEPAIPQHRHRNLNSVADLFPAVR